MDNLLDLDMQREEFEGQADLFAREATVDYIT